MKTIKSEIINVNGIFLEQRTHACFVDLVGNEFNDAEEAAESTEEIIRKEAEVKVAVESKFRSRAYKLFREIDFYKAGAEGNLVSVFLSNWEDFDEIIKEIKEYKNPGISSKDMPIGATGVIIKSLEEDPVYPGRFDGLKVIKSSSFAMKDIEGNDYHLVDEYLVKLDN